MNKLASLLVFTLLASLSAFSETDLPHITVYGTAEELVVPDELNWSLSVKTMGASVEGVATNHLRDVSSVLAYLKKSIPDKEIKTSYMQLNENWVYRDRSNVQDGYYAYTEISFKFTDFTKYLDCWKQLSKFNNLRINRVRFDISNRNEIQNKARLKAVSAARGKAEALAKALGVSLLEPLAVEEISTDTVRLRRYEDTESPQPAVLSENSIEPGTQRITSQVELTFRISTK
ncbi:MAG: SIMPL domain-containing protein [Verrucomicrobia bacterium]|nr:SIMPL domain-containing protein [Verrucomicrobiota bacterium]